MIHGESRFFVNWQMSKEVSKKLFNSSADTENVIIRNWLNSTGIYDRIQFNFNPNQNSQHSKLVHTINQFTQNNFQFTKRCKFSEEKMIVVIETLHYLLRQLID